MVQSSDSSLESGWDASDSQTFIDYGRYFVPEREYQIRTICDLIPPADEKFLVLDLACGEGLLAEAILERFPDAIVHGYDGSREMLEAAKRRLSGFADRFQAKRFDMQSSEWRQLEESPHAVVSSLAIHHLSGEEKQQLFRDLYEMLKPGGALVIADVVAPATEEAEAVAAAAWDENVRERSMRIAGDLSAWERFQAEGWNMYRNDDSDHVDKPSSLFDQLKWLEDAGFADVDVVWMRAGHAVFGGRKR